MMPAIGRGRPRCSRRPTAGGRRTEVLVALVTYLRETGNAPAALRYATALADLAPGDRDVQRLVESLQPERAALGFQRGRSSAPRPAIVRQVGFWN